MSEVFIDNIWKINDFDNVVIDLGPDSLYFDDNTIEIDAHMKISGSSMLDLLITNLSGMETIESNIHFRCPFVPPISLNARYNQIIKT